MISLHLIAPLKGWGSPSLLSTLQRRARRHWCPYGAVAFFLVAPKCVARPLAPWYTSDMGIITCADPKCDEAFPCETCVYGWLTEEAHNGNEDAIKALSSRLWAEWIAQLPPATNPLDVPVEKRSGDTDGSSAKTANKDRRVWKARWTKFDGQWAIETCASAVEGDTVQVTSSSGVKPQVLGRLVRTGIKDDRQVFLPRRDTETSGVEVVEGGWYVDRGGNVIKAVMSKAGRLYGMRWDDETGKLVYEGGLLDNVIGATDAPCEESPEPVAAVKRVEVEPGMWRTADGRIVKVQLSQAGNLYGKLITEDEPKGVYAPGIVKDVVERLSFEDAKAFGRATGACCVCGRELTNGVSIEEGIGPICATRM